MEPTRDEVRAWVQDILAHTKLTPTELARKAGLSSSTLTRLMNKSDGKTVPMLRTVAKIAAAVGVAPLVTGQAGTMDASVGDAAPRQLDDAGWPPRIAAAITALIEDRPAAGAWEVLTNSVEFAGYQPGDIIILDLSEPPVAGDIVCAQVHHWDAQPRTEIVLRVFQPPYLVAATTAPGAWRPYLVDNDRVVIQGVVTECIRQLK